MNSLSFSSAFADILWQIPSLCVLFEGLIMWLNFSRYGGDSMYIYWPIVLVGLTIIVLFLPAPILYHRSRRWFAYSNVST